MIKGYDDHIERAAKGLPPYTHEGLVNKINALNDELDAARSETGRFRDGLTEILAMPWMGHVCPDDEDIIERVRGQSNEIKQLNEQLFAKIKACDALPLVQAKEEEIGQKQIVINRQANQIKKLQAALIEMTATNFMTNPDRWLKLSDEEKDGYRHDAEEQLRVELPEEMA